MTSPQLSFDAFINSEIVTTRLKCFHYPHNAIQDFNVKR